MANKQVTYPTWGALAVLVLLLLSWMFRLHYERVNNFEHRNRFTGATCPVSEECWTRDEGKGVDGPSQDGLSKPQGGTQYGDHPQ